MNKSEMRKLKKLKFYAYELHKNGQIPHDLFILICKFDEGTTEKEINFLKDITEHVLRVKGYYKRNQIEHEEMNKLVLAAYKKFAQDNK